MTGNRNQGTLESPGGVFDKTGLPQPVGPLSCDWQAALWAADKSDLTVDWEVIRLFGNSNSSIARF